MRKILRSEETQFAYERQKQPLPRIGPWQDQLDGLLLADEGRAAEASPSGLGTMPDVDDGLGGARD